MARPAAPPITVPAGLACLFSSCAGFLLDSPDIHGGQARLGAGALGQEGRLLPLRGLSGEGWGDNCIERWGDFDRNRVYCNRILARFAPDSHTLRQRAAAHAFVCSTYRPLAVPFPPSFVFTLRGVQHASLRCSLSPSPALPPPCRCSLPVEMYGRLFGGLFSRPTPSFRRAGANGEAKPCRVFVLDASILIFVLDHTAPLMNHGRTVTGRDTSPVGLV